jgi:hypothetical protein
MGMMQAAPKKSGVFTKKRNLLTAGGRKSINKE